MTRAGLAPDSWQAAVLESEARQVLLLCTRQAGKSTVSAALALWTAVAHDNALVLLLSPTLRQSTELFRKVFGLYVALNRPVRRTDDSMLQMSFENGSRIICLPGTEETIRGYSGVTLLVIDEAARVLDALYYAVRPMLAVSGGRLVALSTPFGRRGWFHQEWQGEGAWERIRITAEQCPRIPAEFLAEERRHLGPEWYAQEYGCAFTLGVGSPLYPPEWLERAERLAVELRGQPRKAKAIGCDPAEGGDRSAWSVVDELGLMFQLSIKTPDTSVVTGQTLALMREYGVVASRVVFDRGGGGKEHADRLRAQGHAVRTVAFGEAVVPELRMGSAGFRERLENREERYVYKNRRAELYGSLRILLDPASGSGFALPAEYTELRRQMGPIPLMFDGEGRLEILPKNKRDPNSTKQTLSELIGHSPDELDSLVCALHAMQHAERRPVVGTAR